MKQLLYFVGAMVIGTCAFADELLVFDNSAKDSKESPYIESMAVKLTEHNLVLRFDGKLQLGRRTRVVNQDGEQQFHLADTKLVVTINNEALEDFILTVAPDDDGELKVFPAKARHRDNDSNVELIIPLSTIKYSPVEVIAETQSLHCSKAGLVMSSGRNLFAIANGAPARIHIESLSVKPELPEITGLKTTTISPVSVTLECQTNNSTTLEVLLKAAGLTDKIVRQNTHSRNKKFTITGLQPDTKYNAIVSGEDFAGRATAVKEIRFRTLKATGEAHKADSWLKVRGKYIVDSSGKPFALGGYSHYLGEYWHNEFPRYGTLALTARYFRSLGFNACRLGLVEHKKWWAASIMNDGSAFERYGGPAGYVRQLVRPLVDQIINEGVYVIIDWHWSYDLDSKKIEKIGQFWEACAIEFRDEPGVAMYQLLNEPTFTDGQTRPDFAPRIRDIVKDYITRIRKHDKRHIILVPDWNCGWGHATESQWKPVNFDPGDPQHQIVYSKHIARQHVTEAFMTSSVDTVADKWDVPIFFDEVENSILMNTRETAWFFDYLMQNPRKYGFLIWVIGQHPQDFARGSSAFAHAYLPKAPFKPTNSEPIVKWWRLKNPQIFKENDQKWLYRYQLPEKLLPAGDYGVVVEGAELGTFVAVALIPEKAVYSPRLLGTYLGNVGRATWHKGAKDFVHPNHIADGQSAVSGAVYWHALEPFVQLVLQVDRPLKDWNEIQIFRLNPKHQMPVPKVIEPYAWFPGNEKFSEGL